MFFMRTRVSSFSLDRDNWGMMGTRVERGHRRITNYGSILIMINYVFMRVMFTQGGFASL
eukprot:8379143-Karenia_brevis.AAC.1